MPRDSSDFASPPLTQSPSGLFTARAWERSRDLLDASRPAPPSERDREFALWVHAEAKSLASQLDRLADPAVPLTRNIRALTDRLWEDAEWARRHADGSQAAAA